MTGSNLFSDAFVWVTAYTALSAHSAYPQHPGERYRTSGPLISSFAEIVHDRTQEKLQIITRCIFGKCTDCNIEFVSFVHWCYMFM